MQVTCPLDFSWLPQHKRHDQEERQGVVAVNVNHLKSGVLMALGTSLNKSQIATLSKDAQDSHQVGMLE